jgi:hypothetical protein
MHLIYYVKLESLFDLANFVLDFATQVESFSMIDVTLNRTLPFFLKQEEWSM